MTWYKGYKIRIRKDKPVGVYAIISDKNGHVVLRLSDVIGQQWGIDICKTAIDQIINFKSFKHKGKEIIPDEDGGL